MAKTKQTKGKAIINDKSTKTQKKGKDKKSKIKTPKVSEKSANSPGRPGPEQTPISRFTVSASELKKGKSEASFQESLTSSVKKKRFTAKQTKNWKLLNKKTQDYVEKCLETGVGFIINKAINENEGHKIDEIQNVLSETVQLVKNNLRVLKAPTKTYGDFSKITQIQKNAGEELNKTRQQEDSLNLAVIEEENAVKELKKQLKRLQSSSDDDLELHPLLQNFEPELHIPSIC